MTGKLLLENEPNYVHYHIKLKYGEVGNYYNELYDAQSDLSYAISKGAKELIQNTERRLLFLEKELSSFDSEIAVEILAAVKIDVDINKAKKTLEKNEELLENLDVPKPAIWQRLKNKLGI